MSDPDRWTVLVPIRILENASLPRGLIEFLEPLSVVLMGYYEVPDQTSPVQARMQFEDRAEDALQEIAEEITSGGGTVETRLVFTKDREQSFDRIATETGCDAILLPNPVAQVDTVLVPVRDDRNVARLASFVATLLSGREITVTLFHATPNADTADDARDILAAVADSLVDTGIPRESVLTTVEVTDDPLAGIVSTAEDHDVVIMGETEPSIASFVFGEFSERIATRSLIPILVVRGAGNDRPLSDSDTEGAPAPSDGTAEPR